jgi:class 3 adenylate cyclase/pimeloyl-ACP methyl ester carboxylesterase
MEPQIQFAKTADGVSIAYYAIGQGPTVVWMELPSHLQAERKLLPDQRRIYEGVSRIATLVRYDHRGFGLSERDISAFQLDTLVSDLEAVVDKLGLTTFVLAGAGGFTAPVAISYAAAHPERVSRLVLGLGFARIAPQFHQQVQTLLLLGSDWRFASEAYFRLALGWEDEERSRAFAAVWREASTFDAFRAFSRDVGQWDVRDLLPSVVMPTLLIHMADSPLAGPEQSREIASLMPDARAAFVDGSTSAERSAQYQAAIVSFLLGTDAVRPELIEQFIGNREARGAQAVAPAGLATVLFTDITDSTALTQRLGDAKAQELVRAHNTIVREALRAHNGSEIKHTGDGIMASFPSASGALECAVAIQRAVGGHGDDQLRVHIGLNAGEPVAEEQDLFGTAVQLARRVCDHAEGGEILASDVVRQLAAGKDFLFSDRGGVVLRGFEDPVRLYEVRWREET